MPRVDAGGRWHATIPRKGNRWIPMPDAALARLNSLIDYEVERADSKPGSGKYRKDFKDLGLRARNVARLLARGDVTGAQAKVQTCVRSSPHRSPEVEAPRPGSAEER